MDTGAQLTVMNVAEIKALGIKPESIFPLATSVNTVTKGSINIIGGVFLVISAYDEQGGLTRKTRQLCYVSTTVKGIYLSKEACVALGCVPTSFPTVGDCGGIEPSELRKCENSGIGPESKCSCPVRALPPQDMPVLPCSPTPENLPKIRDYILKRYEASGFNCCENQPLPLMDTAPPLRLFVDPQATPIAALNPLFTGSQM